MTYSIETDLRANFSSANTVADPGFKQQTFLGASIIDFNISAGFGDSSSTMSINLVNDEYNSGDAFDLGRGDDVYHNGVADMFRPPQMGSPVFFKFGTQFATVSQAFRKTLDDTYPETVGKPSLSTFETFQPASNFNENPGHFHFAFGGILQAINESKGSDGNPKYSAQIVDPREILANVQLILNNYNGTTFNNKNLFNIYGLLEHNIHSDLSYVSSITTGDGTTLSTSDPVVRTDSADGSSNYNGTDMWYDGGKISFQKSLAFGGSARFPITGTGFSRRSSQGMPYYRVAQGLSALLNLNTVMPTVYQEAGYGGYINFRGYNYVVDLSSLPDLPQFFFIDYDQISLMDLCLEICEVTNHEMLVNLLPITDHPSMGNLKKINDSAIEGNMSSIIAGVIKIEVIDRSTPQPLNSIKTYLDNLDTLGVQVTKKNLGTELSNVNTDKFVTGGNEVDMYFFSADADRAAYHYRTQWDLRTSLRQQILPYYGKLPGNNTHPETVTIPKGYGSYQQILLDSSSLNAVGVGNFYVATEMELRAASVSFKRWQNFLLMYDNVYMESIEDNDAEEGSALTEQVVKVPNAVIPPISNNYAVTVPRSVWPTDEEGYDRAGLPLSACNPPYGYPLYYKRATQIGIPTSAFTNISTAATAAMENFNNLQDGIRNKVEKMAGEKEPETDPETGEAGADTDPKFEEDETEPNEGNAGFIDTLFGYITDIAKTAQKVASAYSSPIKGAAKDVLDYMENPNNNFFKMSPNQSQLLSTSIRMQNRVGKKSLENAKKVHSFLKNIADECLGKKFLVRLPEKANPFYSKTITQTQWNYESRDAYGTGPFAFPPRSNSSTTGPNSSLLAKIASISNSRNLDSHRFNTFLGKYSLGKEFLDGGLIGNYNPISAQYEFNYEPEPQGGFFEYDLASNFKFYNGAKQPLTVTQGLSPADPSIFDLGNGRQSAYVRFDNSQNLSFKGFSADAVIQQTTVAGFQVPDLTYTLDNLSPQSPKDLSPLDEPAPKQIAFVKATLDSKIYMAPKVSVTRVGIHAQRIHEEYTVSPPRQIFDPEQCKNVDSLQYSIMVASPLPVAPADFDSITHFNRSVTFGGQSQFDADPQQAYALITLPDRVVPTVDSRLRDGDLQKFNAVNIKHYLRQDVVVGPHGFDVPGMAGTPTDLVGDYSLQPLGKDASAAIKKAKEGVNFALPQKIEFTSPSPVYPDLAVLPLRSKERCYGPWVSSQVGSTADIGGKIEYIKDENLVPWNFSGYDLMNKTGLVKAEFSNSLLLQSERGSFSIPQAPSGISLGKGLQNSGPLVSNISVSVGAGGVTTDYSLDLYTASFGKLQKQRLDNISKIARNQQKLEDEKNALIRKGKGKNQTDVSLQVTYDAIMNNVRSIQPRYSPGEMGQSLAAKHMVMSAIQRNVDATDGRKKMNEIAASISNEDNISDASDQFQGDPNQIVAATENTADSDITDTHAPASLYGGHNAFASMEPLSAESIQDIYNNSDNFHDSNPDEDIVTWQQPKPLPDFDNLA